MVSIRTKFHWHPRSSKFNQAEFNQAWSQAFIPIKGNQGSRPAYDLEWVDAEGGIVSGAILRYPDTVGVKVPAAIWNNLTLTFQECISQSSLWTIKILDAEVNQNT